MRRGVTGLFKRGFSGTDSCVRWDYPKMAKARRKRSASLTITASAPSLTIQAFLLSPARNKSAGNGLFIKGTKNLSRQLLFIISL